MRKKHQRASIQKNHSKSNQNGRELHRQPFERLEQRQLMAAHIVGKSTVYQTIQAAVDAAATNAIITVDAGSYAEMVTITKPMTILGAQAGVDARSNSRYNDNGSGESVITGASGSAGVSTAFYVEASDVTIDGFTIQGETSASTTIGAGLVIGPSMSGTHVFNNILQNNVSGMFLANASSTDAAVIQHNVFRSNNNAGVNGGRGIYTDGSLSGGNLTNVLIDGNMFYNNRGGSGTTTLEAAIAIEALTAGKQSNITVTNNSFDANGKAVLFFNTVGIDIENNYITNTYDQYSGTLRFEGNNQNVTIKYNTVYDNTGPAVAVDAKGVAGDNSGFVVNYNNFYGNSLAYGTHLSVAFDGSVYDGTPDVRYNYWGSASGPGGDGPGTGDTVYGIGHVVPGSQWSVTKGGNENFSGWLTAPYGNNTAPYWGLAADVTQTIQAEDFDHGGEGYAYHDSTTGNAGGKYRPREQVDIEGTSDTGGGYDVYNTVAGEYLDYTVNVAQSGVYSIATRLASQNGGGTFHIEVDGVNVSGSIAVPKTNGTQTWTTLTTNNLNIAAGQHVLRFVFDTNGTGGTVASLNWFKLTNTSASLLPAAPSNLLATTAGTSVVSLTWLDNSSNEANFVIERQTGTSGWTTLATVAANTTSYTDSTTASGTTYVYRVYATNATGSSSDSNTSTVTTPALLATTYVSDLPFVGTPTNGWGPVERDMSVGGQGAGDGDVITLNGVTYTKGLGTNAASSITFALNGNYGSFVSDIGVDDHEGAKGTVDFQVWADGVKLYDSGVMTGNSATQTVDVNIAGKQQLTLIVTDGGDGSDYDQADWAGARLLLTAPIPTVPNAPSNLVATAFSTTQINLTWNDVQNETGFKVLRSTDGVHFTQIATTVAGVTTYSDGGLTAGTSYTYEVVATNAVGDSAASSPVTTSTQSLQTVTYLSDLPFVGTPTNGWGPVERDSDVGGQGAGDGAPIDLNGVIYTKGLGTNAPSSITFALNGNYGSFVSDIGVDDHVGANGSVDFQVFGDGVKLYDSGLMTGNSPTQTINISVAGVQQLTLVATDGGDGADFDHADWAGARLLLTAPVPTVPNAPSNLVASATSTSQINLVWSDVQNETGFKIERSTDGVVFTQIGTTTAGMTSYTDTNLAPGTQYIYRVRATNAVGDSIASAVSAATTQSLQQVTYLSDLPFVGTPTNGWGPVERDSDVGGQGAGDGDPITLNGVVYNKGLGTNALSSITFNLNGQYSTFLSDIGVDDHEGSKGSVDFQVWADGVQIYESGILAGDSATQTINVSVAGVQQLTLIATDGNDGTDYDHADWANARLLLASQPTAPAAPANLAATAASTSQINLTWSDVTGETGFNILRSADGTSFTQIATTAAGVTSYSDSGLSAGTKYYYAVEATNAVGASLNSNVANATTTAAPTSLAASPASVSQINLSWADNSNNETGFVVERSTDGINFSQLTILPANTTSYSDTGLSASTKYFYFVDATNAVGPSVNSNVASATTTAAPTAPAAPTNLAAATASTSQINLTWTDKSTNETAFVVSRSTDGVQFTVIATLAANVTSYSDTGLAASTKYYYAVNATNAVGPSANSNVANATTNAVPTVPAAPTNLAAAAASTSQINLTWTDNANNETGFVIERSTDGTNFTQIAAPVANATSYSDTGLSAGTKYYYRVHAVNAVGSSALSNVANATTAAPAASLPVGMTNADIGTVGKAGSAGYSNGVYSLSGAGAGITGAADGVNFTSEAMSGNHTVTARVTTHSANAGIMLRDGTAANAKEAALTLNTNGTISFTTRATAGGKASTTTTSTKFTGAVYLRLVRNGSIVSAYYSTNGTSFTLMTLTIISMNTSISAGLTVSSGNTTTLATAVMDSFTVV